MNSVLEQIDTTALSGSKEAVAALTHVTKRYSNGVVALDGLSLS